MKPAEIKKLVAEAKDVMTQLEAVKPLYRRLDELTLLLMGLDISGMGLAVVDNFADKNTVFKVAGVKRFDLKVTK